MLVFIRPDLDDTISGMTLSQWSAMGFLIVVGTFAAVIFWNYGVGIVGSARSALLLYVQPVVAAAGGMLFLGEELTWTLLLGGLLIMAGVAVAQVQLPFFAARTREIERQDRRAAVERLVASSKTARLPK
jgi:drug/metabolite transporter (DMT)-like permease